MASMSEKSELVYPWDDGLFKGSVADKECVYENLRKMKYPLKNMKVPPPADLLSAVTFVTSQHLIKDEWVVVVSNSNRLLQAIANFCPVIYSLTTMFACTNVTTDKLLGLFNARRPMDDFSADDAGESLNNIERAGLLVWEDIGEPVSGSTKVAGRFAQMLKKRNSFSCSSLFTLLYTGKTWTAAHEQSMKTSVINVVGETAFSILKEKSEFINFPMAVDERLNVKTIKVGGDK